MLLAMVIAALICIFNGAWPWLLYDMLPFPVAYEPYTATHVLAQCQLLFFSALAFAWPKLSGLYPPELRSINIDAEWIYRKPLKWLAITTMAASGRWHRALLDGCTRSLSWFGRFAFRHSGPKAFSQEPWRRAGPRCGSRSCWPQAFCYITCEGSQYESAAPTGANIRED